MRRRVPPLGALCLWSWAGLANTYFWVDPSKQVAGVILKQIPPFVDPHVLGLYTKFESGVYKALS
jgi:methyl acetate hydrolase